MLRDQISITETWKPVVGFEGLYDVSDQGRVRNVKTRRVLRPGRTSSGHLTVALGRGNTRTVHSLVTDGFLGPCPPGQERRHLDGNTANNALSNLAFGTRGQNNEDRARHGRYKLTSHQVRYIRASPKTGKALAAELACSQSQISNIRRGEQRVRT